jgi:Fic family protein
MAGSIMELTPFIPGDKTLAQSRLPDKAVALVNRAARLGGQLAPVTLDTLTQHMLAINSYYSNLIEGNAARPHEIRAAQRGDYSGDPAKRDLQQESLAHMEVQQWLRTQNPDLDTLFTAEFICMLHAKFYERVPRNLWLISDAKGKAAEKIVPGAWRLA